MSMQSEERRRRGLTSHRGHVAQVVLIGWSLMDVLVPPFEGALLNSVWNALEAVTIVLLAGSVGFSIVRVKRWNRLVDILILAATGCAFVFWVAFSYFGYLADFFWPAFG